MPCARELLSTFFFAPILTLAPSLYLALRNKTRSRQRLPSPVHSTISAIQTCLVPPGLSFVELLKERAKANVRLTGALGLTNTFVDPDPRIHAEFVRRARGLLKDAQTSGWARFRDICGDAVRCTLAEYPGLITPKEGTYDIPLDLFVQIVVLRTVLAGFLNTGRESEDLEIDSLAQVTSLINELWTLSKKDVPPPSHLSQSLHSHLRRLLPPAADFDNPIDFVVPTWETMWRVCATTIARTSKAEEYRAAFREFLQTGSLTSRQFGTVGSQGFSVKDFVEETMRLHPPVKHISRLRSQKHPDAVSSDPFMLFGRLRAWITGTDVRVEDSTREVADIESVLQTQTVWGRDAHVFNPRRHQTSDSNMKEALRFVFGYGSLRCVAASWAPLAAAIICATVMEECRELGWEVVPGERIGGRLGWEGWKLLKCDGVSQ